MEFAARKKEEEGVYRSGWKSRHDEYEDWANNGGSRVRRRLHSSSLTPHNTFAKQARLDSSSPPILSLFSFPDFCTRFTRRFLLLFFLLSVFYAVLFGFFFSFLWERERKRERLTTRNNVYLGSWHGFWSGRIHERFSFSSSYRVWE